MWNERTQLEVLLSEVAYRADNLNRVQTTSAALSASYKYAVCLNYKDLLRFDDDISIQPLGCRN